MQHLPNGPPCFGLGWVSSAGSNDLPCAGPVPEPVLTLACPVDLEDALHQVSPRVVSCRLNDLASTPLRRRTIALARPHSGAIVALLSRDVCGAEGLPRAIHSTWLASGSTSRLDSGRRRAATPREAATSRPPCPARVESVARPALRRLLPPEQLCLHVDSAKAAGDSPCASHPSNAVIAPG